MKKLKSLFLLAISIIAFSSCSSIKAYEKMKINDAEMELSARKAEKFEQNFQLYREGSSGANGGKSGGGCGCN
jgi:PBP1b-binding outer membrane lipoprotein LpoB